MAGLDKSSALPTRIVVHKQSRVLEIEFNDGRIFRLPFEFLRVNSPSAEVRGHGPGQEVLQTGKRAVDIASLDFGGDELELGSAGDIYRDLKGEVEPGNLPEEVPD